MSVENSAGPRPPPLAIGGAQAVAATVFLLLLIRWAFVRWMSLTWYGDDLENYRHLFLGKLFASNPIQSLTSGIEDKFRPVNALVMEAAFTTFGPNIRGYL